MLTTNVTLNALDATLNSLVDENGVTGPGTHRQRHDAAFKGDVAAPAALASTPPMPPRTTDLNAASITDHRRSDLTTRCVYTTIITIDALNATYNSTINETALRRALTVNATGATF